MQFGFPVTTGDGMTPPQSDKHSRIKLVTLKNKTPHDKPRGQGPKGSTNLPSCSSHSLSSVLKYLLPGIRGRSGTSVRCVKHVTSLLCIIVHLKMVRVRFS